MKIRQMNIDIFSNEILLELIDYLLWFIQIKMTIYKMLRYCFPKGIIDNFNVIINGKNFYDQVIDSDIKRYKKIRKWTTWLGEDYPSGCLINYYIKNHYRLIAVDLRIQSELDAEQNKTKPT